MECKEGQYRKNVRTLDECVVTECVSEYFGGYKEVKPSPNTERTRVVCPNNQYWDGKSCMTRPIYQPTPYTYPSSSPYPYDSPKPTVIYEKVPIPDETLMPREPIQLNYNEQKPMYYNSTPYTEPTKTLPEKTSFEENSLLRAVIKFIGE